MNVKPGDLAIVVKSTCGNEGKIVFVESYIGRHKFWNGHRENVWLCRFSGPRRHRLSDLEMDVVLITDSEPSRIPDAWLRPVSGLPDTSDVDDQLKEPAHD